MGKKSKPQGQQRAVPASYCYPVPAVDLENGRLDWIGTRPTQSRPSPPLPSIDEMLELVARRRARLPREGALQESARLVTDRFLDPRPGLTNPLSGFAECQIACTRIARAMEKRESILVYGDYDCDGVTSVTLMLDALGAFGFEDAQVDHFIPHRLLHGYGLQARWVKERMEVLETEGKPLPSLLIALDCGSGSGSEIAKLRTAHPQLDLMIIDHHQPNACDPFPADPEHVFHVNPKLWRHTLPWDPQVGLDKMCAAGLAFLFGWALLPDKQRVRRWRKDRALILAGLGTCVDVVELTGVNRVLLKHSLALANTPASLARVPGLAKLKSLLGPSPASGLPVTEATYGYYWGPCINAAGRMGDASNALRLLRATDDNEAESFAKICINANRLRKATQRAMADEAGRMAEQQIAQHNPAFLTLSSLAWHPGVVGIVASQIKTSYRRPAIVATALPDPENQDGIVWTGSGRSVEGCRMGELFQKAAHATPRVILKGGGHDMAGGLRFSEDQRNNLSAGLEKHSAWRPDMSTSTAEVITSPSSLAPLEWGAIFRRLAPFGNGSEPPALVVEVAELRQVHVFTHARKDRYLAQSRPMQQQGYWSFRGEDILDLVPLRERLLQDSGPISAYVRSQLPPRVVGELQNFRDFKSDSDRVSAALASGLNQLLPVTSLHNADRFNKIKLRWQTRTLLRQQMPSGSRLAQLNRMLLEDAFPRELKRKGIERLPSAWGYEGEFMDLLTGRVFHAVWPVLEEAEMLWQPHEFLAEREPGERPFVLPHYLRLQLEVSVFVPSREWSNVYRGAHFERDTRFRVRQCIPLKKGPIWKIRMPAVKPGA